MKKVNKFWNWFAPIFGGTRVTVYDKYVLHEHFRLFLFGSDKLSLPKCVLAWTEKYRKDGKVIVEEFYDELDEDGQEKSQVWKYNYLDYSYDFFQKKDCELVS